MAQDYFSYASGNYSSLNHLLANPAAANGGRSRLDVNLSAFELGFSNSFLLLRREALAYPTLPNSWQNKTPNVPNNVYKNFSIKGQNEPNSMLLEQRRMLPSIYFRIDKKQSAAFICSYRQFGNLDGISSAMTNLFEKEFDLSVLQNKAFQNKNLNVLKMNWLEYGFNYARSFRLASGHELSAGLTLKLLQGLESAYFTGRNLAYLFSTVDTNSFLSADFSFARSPGASADVDFRGKFLNQLPNATALQPGFDLGFMYVWKDNRVAAGKDSAGYRLRAGISLMDAGRIRFMKANDYYDLNVHVTQGDIVRYLSLGTSRAVDSLIRKDFPANTGSREFTVLTPMALNLQADYHVLSRYYLNFSAHITGFYKNNLMKVHSATAFCLTPRFEHYWLEVALPMTCNVLSAGVNQWLQPGLSVRAGPLRIGTNDVTVLFRKNIASLHVYALLQLSLEKLKRSQLKRWRN